MWYFLRSFQRKYVRFWTNNENLVYIVFIRLAIPLKPIMILIWIWVELCDFLRIKVSPTCGKPINFSLNFLHGRPSEWLCFSNHIEKASLQIWEFSHCIWEFFWSMHSFEVCINFEECILLCGLLLLSFFKRSLLIYLETHTLVCIQ